MSECIFLHTCTLSYLSTIKIMKLAVIQSIDFLQILPVIPIVSLIEKKEKLIQESKPGLCTIFKLSWNFSLFQSGIFSQSLPLLTLTCLKSRDQLFCKMHLSLGLSDVSSWFDSHYPFLARTLQKWYCVLCVLYKAWVSVCLITGLFPWVRCYWSKLFTAESLFFSFKC